MSAVDKAYNIFGVVLDASYPHRVKNGDHFVCTLKVAESAESEACTLVLFGSKFEEMPICQRVGDIIRVHRVIVTEYCGVKQFTSRLYYNSAWAIFSPIVKLGSKKLGFISDDEETSEFTPVKYFGKKYSPVDKVQQKFIKELRKWNNKEAHSKCLITLSDIAGLYKEGKQNHNFDLVATVEKLDRIDEDHSELALSDKTTDKPFTATVFTRKYRWLKEG